MRKNTQKIAFYILIPMLVFTFTVTIISEKIPYTNDAQKVILKYLDYKNNDDIESIEKLLFNKNDINIIKEENKYLKNIKLISIEEEKDENIKSEYIKNNYSVVDKIIEIYKVTYEVTYDTQSLYYNKSETYDDWYFLINTGNDNWLIDIGV